MRSFNIQRFCLPQPLLLSLLLAALAFLAGGCNPAQESASAPALSPEQAIADKIKSVESDPRMPADVKAKEIARIKAEGQASP